jgi:hypothetical protein
VYKEGESIQTFLKKFSEVARRFGWSEEDEFFELKNRIEGPAADLIYAQEPSTLAELQHLLVSSYGQLGQQRQVRILLGSRKRQQGESLQHLCVDIRRSLSIAFPGIDAQIRDVLALDHFVRALDSHLQDRVRTRGAETLEAALSCAMEFDVSAAANSSGSSSIVNQRSSGQSNENGQRGGQNTPNWQRGRGGNHARRAGRGGKQPNTNPKPTAEDANGKSTVGPDGPNISIEALKAVLSTFRNESQQSKRDSGSDDAGRARQQTQFSSNSDGRRHNDRSSQPKRFSDEMQGQYERGECFNCGRTGHKSRQCTEERKGQSGRNNRPTDCSDSEERRDRSPDGPPASRKKR